MLDLLSDCNTFKVVESDETIIQEDRLIRKLKQLKTSGFITEQEYKFLSSKRLSTSKNLRFT